MLVKYTRNNHCSFIESYVIECGGIELMMDSGGIESLISSGGDESLMSSSGD